MFGTTLSLGCKAESSLQHNQQLGRVNTVDIVCKKTLIGRKPIPLPKGVQVEFNRPNLKIKGPLGELKHRVPKILELKVEPEQLTYTINRQRLIDEKDRNMVKHYNSVWGGWRGFTQNMVTGVTDGFTTQLRLFGVGFRANYDKAANEIVLNLGFCDLKRQKVDPGISVEVTEKDTLITLKGIDKQKLNHFAARVRSYKKPDVYKGKGVRYEGETVRIIKPKGK